MDEYKSLSPDESISQQLADDAVPVCPNCLEPCDPRDNYCPYCDSNEAINPLVSYMPFVDLRFRMGVYGKVWNNLWKEDKSVISKIFGVFILISGAKTLLVVGLPLRLIGKIKNPKKQKFVTVVFYAVLSLLVLTGVLWLVIYQ